MLLSLLLSFLSVGVQAKEIKERKVATLSSEFNLDQWDFVTRDACSEYLINIGPFEAQRTDMGAIGCFLRTGKSKTTNLKYRLFYMSQIGGFMVFNSYGMGPDSTDTGARTFFFFPMGALPDIQPQGNKIVIQTGNPNLQIYVDMKTGMITGSSLGKVTEAQQVSKKNRGGVEFKGIKGVYMDTGFAIGKDPASDPTGKATLHDALGKTCQVVNKEILLYDGNNDYQSRFTNDDLRAFLKSKCPNLSLW